MLKKIFRILGNSLNAILRGEFLVRLGAANYFRQILFIFLMIGVVIWASLSIDSTLNEVERNKKELKDLKTLEAIKSFELEQYKNREVILEAIVKKGSSLRPSKSPSTVLRNKEKSQDEAVME